jgi:hypothetical protein
MSGGLQVLTAGTASKASISFIGRASGDARLATYFSRTTAVEGYTNVLAHGTRQGTFAVTVNGEVQEINHRVFARLLQGRGYDGGDIRLVSCFSGETGAAQNLANKMGVNVLASKEGLAWVHANGRLSSGANSLFDKGFRQFNPGNK